MTKINKMKNIFIIAIIFSLSFSSSCTKESDTCKTCVGVVKRKMEGTDEVYSTTYITNEFCNDELQFVIDNPYKKVVETFPDVNITDTVWTRYTCD